MSLSSRFTDTVALCIGRRGVVSYVLVTRLNELVADRNAVGVLHQNLRTLHTGRLGDILERQVTVVDVEGVVVSGMVQVFKVAEVLVHQVAHEYVQPAVIVDIGAGDAGGRARVHRVPERRGGNVGEGAVIHVQKQRVEVALLRRPEAQIVCRIAP